MYLSEVHLSNWRSYADARFVFKRPSGRRPLVLIGAMNGHGKTSLLFALYLGLFGRFGLRHAEGFSAHDGEDTPYYRRAIQKFRRMGSQPDDATSVELVFSPTESDTDSHEIRIVRRWFFTPLGPPRQGESFETVDLYVDGKPQKLHLGLDAAHDRIERFLFPAHVMPAFFFDGEQAQTLINNSGEAGIKKAVEVLFGTKVIQETSEQVEQYIRAAQGKLGGKRNTTSQQQALEVKLGERQVMNEHIAGLNRKVTEIEHQKGGLEKSQRQLQDTLSRLGGERRATIEEAHTEVARAEREKLEAEKALTQTARQLGLALAVSRLSPAIRNRLDSEMARERWESLRDGTVIRTDEVLQVALPEPPEIDTLLGNLDLDLRRKVRDRFKRAIEQIYNPPPNDCASEYLLGHARGEVRNRVLESINSVRSFGTKEIKARTKRLKEARERQEDAIARRDRIGNLPQEVKELSDQLSEIGEQITDASRQLGSLENESKSKKAALQELNAEIGRLQEFLAKMGPEQKRIAIAERVHRVLNQLDQELRPITLTRVEDLITKHFLAIADKRFKGGRIEFPNGSSPILRRPEHDDRLIESMSGFERRSFGIAFSLALAEITKRRVPLVIDTPLGNADTEYRERLLKALTDVDLDQVIILSHNAEVAGPLFEQIESQVRQTFLVEFDADKRESMVTADAYFEGVGA